MTGSDPAAPASQNLTPASTTEGLFAIARSIDRLAAVVDRAAQAGAAREPAERLAEAIARISHGDVHGPAGLEMLSMAIAGEGKFDSCNCLASAIAAGFGEVAEAIRDA